MRNLIFLLLLLLIVFQSCTDDSLSYTPTYSDTKVLPRTEFTYAQAGTVHNAGLDLVMQSENDWLEMERAEGLDSLWDIIHPFVNTATGTSSLSTGLSTFNSTLGIILDDWTNGNLMNEISDVKANIWWSTTKSLYTY